MPPIDIHVHFNISFDNISMVILTLVIAISTFFNSYTANKNGKAQLTIAAYKDIFELYSATNLVRFSIINKKHLDTRIFSAFEISFETFQFFFSIKEYKLLDKFRYHAKEYKSECYGENDEYYNSTIEQNINNQLNEKLFYSENTKQQAAVKWIDNNWEEIKHIFINKLKVPCFSH